MNSIADLGGMDGLGPINPEKGEPVFHAEWERRTMGLTLLAIMQGHFNVDQIRHAIERMDPVEYLGSEYYSHWLHGTEELLIQNGVVTRAELEAKRAVLAGES